MGIVRDVADRVIILKKGELVFDGSPDDETEIETRIELNLGFVKVSRVVKIKKY